MYELPTAASRTRALITSIYGQTRARRNPGHPQADLPPQGTQAHPGELQHQARSLTQQLKCTYPKERQS